MNIELSLNKIIPFFACKGKTFTQQYCKAKDIAHYNCLQNVVGKNCSGKIVQAQEIKIL